LIPNKKKSPSSKAWSAKYSLPWKWTLQLLLLQEN